jgi:Spy/CpxP family protein refolding chaperone
MRLTKSYMTAGALLAVLWAPGLLGQNPQRPGAAQASGPRQALAATLGLGLPQMEQLAALAKEKQQAMVPVRQQATKAQQALQEAMSSGTPDPGIVGKLALELRAARQQAQQTNQTFHNRALNVLTEDQKAKLKDLQELARRTNRTRTALGAAGLLNLLEPPQQPAGSGSGAQLRNRLRVRQLRLGAV